MKVTEQGVGTISLSTNDLVGSGGEGDVFVKGNTAYKIYHDPSKMIPSGKIQNLSALTDPDIIKPEHVLLSEKQVPIGYTMRFLPKSIVLCQLFPPVFRQRNNVTPDMTLALVRKFQERVSHTHEAGILVVDLNEMNYLVNAGFDNVFAIDVDSYQTPHYPATAIMPNIRDPRVQGNAFTELSDWFSFGILAFNLFVGIHPYKGKHPTIHGFEDRMKAGISVFNSSVSVPKVVLPFTVIPDVYRQWFEAVLEGGKRLPPPADLYGTITIIPTTRILTGTGNLDITDLFDFTGSVMRTWDHPEGTVIWTNEGLYLDNRRLHGITNGIQGIGFSPMIHPVVAGVSKQMLKLFDAYTQTEIPVNLYADEVMSQNGRLYVRSGDKILEMTLTDMGSKVLATSQIRSTCLPNASHLYQGVVIQPALGSTFATLFPNAGQAYRIHLKELDTYKVLDARFENTPGKGNTGVLMVVAAKAGKHDRFVFRFDEYFLTYDVRKVEDITPSGLNFVVLDSGVCVSLTEEEKLEVFSVVKGASSMKVVEDPMLGSDMILGRRGGRVIFWRGNNVYQMRMK